jgi:prophage antirepressor-like protein
MALTIASSLEFSSQSFTVYLDPDNETWFQGLESCNQLELTNPTLTLQRHVSPQYRCQIADGRGKPAWFIKEPGLYQLIFASKSERAEKFREWVFKDILPTIRKTGSYTATAADQQHFAPFGITLQLKIDECDRAIETAAVSTGKVRAILADRKALEQAYRTQPEAKDAMEPSVITPILEAWHGAFGDTAMSIQNALPKLKLNFSAKEMGYLLRSNVGVLGSFKLIRTNKSREGRKWRVIKIE